MNISTSLISTLSIAAILLYSAVATARPGGLCGSFESVPTPGQGQAGRVISALAVRADTGFAVGRFYPEGSGAFVPLLYRYNGTAWLEQGLPPLDAPASDPILMSVAMSSATGNSAWIVGYVSVPAPTNNLPLIARWRNGSFDRVDTPVLRPQPGGGPFSARTGFGSDAVVLAENNVWVVGQARDQLPGFLRLSRGGLCGLLNIHLGSDGGFKPSGPA